MGMKGNKFWQFRAAADKKSGDLLLYGPISSTTWWGDEVTPKQFNEDLKALGDVETINVYINSGGGDVFAAQAIYSMLKRHSAAKHVYIDGLAASGASLIAMVGDTVTMPKNAMMMIHGPWTWGAGFAADFRKVADELDKIREAMIPVYSDKSGLSREEIIAIMDAETWLTAEEAVDKGFADEVEEAKEIAASIQDGTLTINGQTVDLSKFRNAPKDIGHKPPARVDSPGADIANQPAAPRVDSGAAITPPADVDTLERRRRKAQARARLLALR
jgi:ATP-dependent Clp protease protease subunit